MDNLFNNLKVPNQANQVQTQIMIERGNGKPVVCRDASHAQGARKTSRSQEIETRSFHEEAVKHDRTEKPVVCRDTCHEQGTVVCSEQTTHPRFSYEGQTLILEEETNHDRTVKPVVCNDAGHAQGASQTRSSYESTNFNVEDETNHDREVKARSRCLP